MIRVRPEHQGEYWLRQGTLEGETRRGVRYAIVNGVYWLGGAGLENAVRMVNHVETVVQSFRAPAKKR